MKHWKYIAGTIAAILVLTAAAYAIWFYLKPSDERLIRTRLSDFCQEVSKPGNEGMVNSVSHARKAARMFAESCTFSYENRSWNTGPYSHDKLSGDILRYRSMMLCFTLSLADIELTLQPEERTAKVSMTVSIDGKFRDGSRCHEAFEVRGNLLKQDSEWLLGSFSIRKLLHK